MPDVNSSRSIPKLSCDKALECAAVTAARHFPANTSIIFSTRPPRPLVPDDQRHLGTCRAGRTCVAAGPLLPGCRRRSPRAARRCRQPRVNCIGTRPVSRRGSTWAAEVGHGRRAGERLGRRQPVVLIALNLAVAELQGRILPGPADGGLSVAADRRAEELQTIYVRPPSCTP